MTKRTDRNFYNADNWLLTAGHIQAFGVTYFGSESVALLRDLIGVRLALDFQLVLKVNTPNSERIPELRKK